MADPLRAKSRKSALVESFTAQGLTRAQWRGRAQFFHDEDTRYLRFLIPPGLRILELGCGAGHTLAALQPARGVGIELIDALVEEGRRAFPQLELYVGDIEDETTFAAIEGVFDVILLVDTIGQLEDCQVLLQRLHRFCGRETRLIVVYYSHFWEPLLKLASLLHWKMREPTKNVLAPLDVKGMAELAGFDTITMERRILSPIAILGVGRLINRFLGPLPLLRQLALRHYVVCRSLDCPSDKPRSATVVIPVRNERGSIEAAIRRLPRFCPDIEVIFVEGHSKDGTLDEVKRVIAKHPAWDIKVIVQPGTGKADAVFSGFDAARGDILMILDGDLSVPPEWLCRFWHAIVSGRGEFLNGSRLVYPMEEAAMPLLNLAANRFFSIVFTWILNQRYTDTLCGTKVLWRSDYLRLKSSSRLGHMDPFGDFDLIFGAARLSLKTLEIPIRYAARSYGQTQISRFRHGCLLLKMVTVAFLRIKAV